MVGAVNTCFLILELLLVKGSSQNGNVDIGICLAWLGLAIVDWRVVVPCIYVVQGELGCPPL